MKVQKNTILKMSYEVCSLSEASKRLAQFYQNFNGSGKFNRGNVAGGFVGGTAATGGMSSVAEYADSVYSKAKEDMIRKIASDMNDILGIKGDKKLKSDGPIESLVARMNDILPNPRKKRGIRSNKGAETKYSSVHKDLCKALAESINKNYGTHIINLEQSDNALCNSVAEVVHSLIMGMHSEFSTIAADVSQVIRNLTVLMEYLKRSHEKMKQVVDASNDENIKLQSERVDGFYTKLVSETERQLAVLNNMMGGVIGPVNNDFVSLMKESDDFKGFVDDIKSSLGSEEFGNKLGYLLAGVNNLAQTAKMVDKALKEVGMSVKAYKNTTGIENLRDEIYSILSKSDKLTADGLLKFMKAADVLYRNDLQHEQIVEYLEKGGKSGGDSYGGCPYCGASGGCGCGGASGGKGEFTEIFERKENIENDKFKAQDKVRKAIFRDFEKQLLSIYQRIISVVQQIGPKIGNEIQPSDDLMKFVRAFNQIEGANRQNIATALSGYNKSGAAKDVRNSFLSSLDVVDITLDSLISRHALFKDLRNEISILMKLVETFSTKFVEALVTPPSFTSTTGGEIGGVIVNTEPPVGMTERYASFGRAQFQLYYFSRIASIKRSMARAASEKRSTNEDYEKLVGQASARLINAQATDYKTVVDSLASWNKKPSDFKTFAEFEKALPAGSPGRALYFFVNTVSGYEPVVLNPAVPLPGTFWKGNITEAGAGAGVGLHVAHVGVGWAAPMAFVAALPPRFVALWNFNDGAGNHTPVEAHINNIQNPSLFDPATNFLTALGCEPADFTTMSGAVPRAFDKNYKDANGKLSLLGRRYEAANKLVDILKELEASAFNAKKDLIEVAQNVDLYLSSFTDSMLSKPEALLGLAKILQRVAVVRKMYTDNSGDHLAKVFEMFPVQILNNRAAGVHKGPAAFDVFGSDGIRMPGQSLSESTAGGDAKTFDGKSHYYEYVKSVLDSNSSIGNHHMALNLTSIFDKDSNNSLEQLVKTIEKSVYGIRALENILLAFVQLGNEQTSKTFMSHGKVLKSLFNYIVYSAITRHYATDRGASNRLNDFTPHVPAFAAVNRTPQGATGLWEKIMGFDQFGPLRVALTVTLNQTSAYAAANSIFQDDFRVTDNIMELILKAICSKVLTVLGLYQIYNRPTTEYLSFGAIRSIIGGGAVSRPKIIPEAIDLYVRVPLLIEWFRDIFVGKSDKQTRSINLSTDTYMLALIPDVTNQYGELLKTIFIKAENVEEGNYSEDDTNTIITEINKLYNAHRSKTPNDTVTSVCEAIISELNSRYSIVKKTEVDKYWDVMKKDRFQADAFESRGDEDFVDFDLLDSANGIKGKPAPSDKYADVTIIQAAKDSGSWSTETFDLIKRLHARVFRNFREGYQNITGKLNLLEKDSRQEVGDFNILKYSFDGVIRQYKDELAIANSEDEKYRIACKAVQDVGRMADINPDKIVMLHEFVIAPLTTLMSTYNLVRNVVESFIHMSKESLDKVLTYLNGICAVQQHDFGAACTGANVSELDDTGNANANQINPAHFNRVLENSLRLFNPQAAPLLQSLFVTQEDAADHEAAGVDVFNVANVSNNAHASLLLSTKKIFKTHMQLFAGLKSALGDKFVLNFTNQSYPVLDMNPLVSHCENLLNNVKKAMVYLRPNLPVNILRKYEDSKNVGSIYWLEEHMFSELFYNEKNWRDFENSSYTYPIDDVTMTNFAALKQTKINATLPLLNRALKSSFGVVVNRSRLNNGKALCERALLELCVWGMDRAPRQEVNNDAKVTFPFNVIDLVDDIDPALGKVRRLMLDTSLRASVAEIAKRLGTIETNGTIAKPLHDRVYNLLRLFSISTSTVAGMQVTNLDAQANKHNNPKSVTEFLDDTIALFMDEAGGNATTKIGTPAFGTFCIPFFWSGESIAVASIATAVGVAAQIAGATDAAPGHETTFAGFKGVVDAAIVAGRSRLGAVPVASAIPLPAALAVNNAATQRAMGVRVGNWITAQMAALNEHFAPYIRALDELEIPETKTFLEQTLRVPPAVLTDLQEVKKSLSQYRFALGFRHLFTVTTYTNAVSNTSLGISVVAAPLYMATSPHAITFAKSFNEHLSPSFAHLLNYTDGVIDNTLRSTVVANLAEHSTNINNLRNDLIIANIDLASTRWVSGGPRVDMSLISAITVEHLGANHGRRNINLLMSKSARQLFDSGLLNPAVATAAMAEADMVASWNLTGAVARANFTAAYNAAPDVEDAGFGGLAFFAHLAMNMGTAAQNTAAVNAANDVVRRSCEAAAGGGNNKYIRAAVTAGGGDFVHAPPGTFSSAAGALAATQTFLALRALMMDNVAFGNVPTPADRDALVLTYLNALESALVTAIGGRRTQTIAAGPADIAVPVSGVHALNDILLDVEFSRAFRHASTTLGAVSVNNQSHGIAILYRNSANTGNAAIGTIFNGFARLNLANPVLNSELPYVRMADCRGQLVGYPYLLTLRDATLTGSVGLGALNTAAAADAANITTAHGLGGANNVAARITRLSAVQAEPLDSSSLPKAADNGKAEAWLRSFVSRYIGTPDMNIVINGVNKLMGEQFGVGLDNIANIRPRFEGLNVAFILNRVQIYDQWGDQGMMAIKNNLNEQSIFNSKGLLAQFNQLLAAYIGSFIEPGSKKFYAPLIEGLVNSKISDAITSGNAIADINIRSVNGIGIPSEGTVVCASIARAIRSLLYKKLEANNKESQYATNSLLEVAGFMRETMKANLPHFTKMFTQLADIAVMYKKVLLDNPMVKYERPDVPPGNPGHIDYDPTQVAQSEQFVSKTQKAYLDPNVAVNENNVLRYYRTLLDNLELACTSVLRCISQCYKELNDSSLFGETYSGSIMEIKQRTGKYPLTLPSVLQTFLHHKCYNAGFGLPGAKHGSDNFKLLFMSRRCVIDSGKVSGGAISTLDYMPGLIETINNYNSLSNDATKLPKALIESSIQSNMNLMNILFDLKLRASWILDASTTGASLFRREIYGSAQAVDLYQAVDAGGAGIGYNTLNQAAQIGLLSTDEFVEFARSRGLSVSNRNQSIYQLSEPEIEYEFNLSNVARTDKNIMKLKRVSNVTNAFNNTERYPDVPAALAPAVRPTPADNDQRLVAFSDILQYPTALVSYAFSSADNITDLITLCESSDISYNKRNLLKLFAGIAENSNNERKNTRFYNILDLNVVPIDFHALQRKVPLINLLNYAFTFDKFVIERLGVQPNYSANNDHVFDEGEANVNDVKSAFARMLIHPYAAITPEHFNTWHSRIAVGATGSDIPMDRPKYFSDQIYNKVCLQSLNPSDYENPGGPGYAMENKRSQTINLASVNAAFTNAQTTTMLNYAVGANVGNVTAPERDLIRRVLIGVNGAAVTGIVDIGAAIAAAGAPAAPANVALGAVGSTAYVNAVENTLVSYVNGFAINPDSRQLRDAVIRGVREVCQVARAATNQANAVINIGRVRYTHATNGAPPRQNELFDDAVLLRTITLCIAESLQGNYANQPLVQKVDALYYIADSDSDKVKRVDLPRGDGGFAVNVMGKLRYDTRLVRNLSWITHLHRFLLWSIKQTLVKQSQPVVNDAGVIDPSLIEFRGYETQSRKEYHL